MNYQTIFAQAQTWLGTEDGAAFVLIASALALYMAPSFIASARKHHQWAAILVLNVLLGWTALFWVVSLAWSLSWVRR